MISFVIQVVCGVCACAWKTEKWDEGNELFYECSKQSLDADAVSFVCVHMKRVGVFLSGFKCGRSIYLCACDAIRGFSPRSSSRSLLLSNKA